VRGGHETAELAYEVALQGGRMKLGDSPDMVSVALRVTSIFRREEGGRKLVHRHGDAITQQRPPESLAQGSAPASYG
jgi:ketosteroid isomerase-like protein